MMISKTYVIRATITSFALTAAFASCNAYADNGQYGPAPGYAAPAPQGYNQGYGGGYPPRGYGNAPGYNSGPGFSGPWNNSGSSWGPFGNRGNSGNRGSSFGPFGNSGNRGSSWGPFGNSGNRGNRGNFGDFNNPFSHRSPGSWMSPDRDNWSRNWDDTLNAPSRMGRMPGGWDAPSISAPNPIDVGDEFGDAARDVPDQMRNLNNNY